MGGSMLQVIGLIIGFTGCCLATVATLRADWMRSDPGGPGKTMSKAWTHVAGLWKECIGYTSGQWHCDGFGDFFLRYSVHLVLSRTLMVVGVAAAGLAVLFNLAGMDCTGFLSHSKKVKKHLYQTSAVLFGLSAACLTITVIWYAVRTSNRFLWCIQQQTNGMKINSGQCMRFGQGLYVAMGATALIYVTLACVICSIPHIDSDKEDFSMAPYKERKYEPHTYKHKHTVAQEYI